MYAYLRKPKPVLKQMELPFTQLPNVPLQNFPAHLVARYSVKQKYKNDDTKAPLHPTMCVFVCVCVCVYTTYSTHTRYIPYMYKKRPTTVSKETYYSVKRDLLQCQKSQNIPPTVRIHGISPAIHMHSLSTCTYYSVKRALLQCQKSPNVETSCRTHAISYTHTR